MPPPPTAQQKADILKLEEEKLKSKFPNLPGRPARGGHSSFLQKRLAKGQKFFDSGDYQVSRLLHTSYTNIYYLSKMAKQSHRLVPGGPVASPALALPTGQAHPTPSSVPGTGEETFTKKTYHIFALSFHTEPFQLGRLQSSLRIHTMITQVIISTHILKDLITFNKHRPKELINCLLSLVGLNVQPTTHVI